jgi:Rab GDP dissociation inhibitor
MTMRQLYNDFGLVPDTHQFISHAMCLQLDEKHMDEPALKTLTELQTYMYSLKRYGTSPYIYPLYGLGGLPEGFSRICAIHGGTFMLNQDIDEILFTESGEAYGVKAGNQMAKAAMVIGDPSYFPPEKIMPTGVVVRCICLLNHVSLLHWFFVSNSEARSQSLCVVLTRCSLNCLLTTLANPEHEQRRVGSDCYPRPASGTRQ